MNCIILYLLAFGITMIVCYALCTIAKESNDERKSQKQKLTPIQKKGNNNNESI